MMDSENPRIVYADIIDHPHHQSETRAHMTLYDRAAQFSAFDALAGYSDMIAEEARVTDQEIELDENAKELLNQKLLFISDLVKAGERPTITFTVFSPDQSKAGGSYELITSEVKSIDILSQRVVLAEKKRSGLNCMIDIQQIIKIDGEIIGKMEAVSAD